MPIAFPESLRSIATDPFERVSTPMLVGVLLLGLWAAWFFGAQVGVTEISHTAQIEVAGAIAVAAPAMGKLDSIYAISGQPVSRGDLLFEIQTTTGQNRRIRALADGHLHETIALLPGSGVQEGDTLGIIVPQGPLQVVATFPTQALGRIQADQTAWVRLDGYTWTRYGSMQAQVEQVARDSQSGLVQVHLTLTADSPPPIPLQHGLVGTVEVEVERISPATLVLRTAGHMLETAPNQ